MADKIEGTAVLGSEVTTPVPIHAWRHAQQQPALHSAAQEIQRYLEDLARESSTPTHLIEARPKTLASYLAKSQRKKKNGEPKYTDPATEIKDCVAARVIVYTASARADFVNMIKKRTDVSEHGNPGWDRPNGYDSDHIVISTILEDGALDRLPALTRYFANYSGLEIQVRSVAGHAWAEYEHDIRYKPGAYQELPKRDKEQVDLWFAEAGGLRRFMDVVFDQIDGLLRPPGADDSVKPSDSTLSEDGSSPEFSDPRPLGGSALTELVNSRFPDGPLGDPSELTAILTQLSELGVDTVGKLEAILSNLESDEVAKLMGYTVEPTRIRRLDDELLAYYNEAYVERASDDGRRQILDLRLRRVRKRFAIYSLRTPDAPDPKPVTAARTVRELIPIIAERAGREATHVNGLVEPNPGSQQSAKVRQVAAPGGPIQVSANLSRANAELIMQELVSRAPGVGLQILRGGDPFCESPPSVNDESDPGAEPTPVEQPIDS